MNVELLQRVKEHILEEPLRLRMEDWVLTKQMVEDDPETYYLGDNKNFVFPACNTVGCISGWASLLSGFTNGHSSVGQEVLKLSGPEAEGLFWIGNWSPEFKKQYRQAEPQSMERAKVVAAVIDAFIESPWRRGPRTAV